MKTQLLKLVAAGTLSLVAGGALAAQALNDQELDGVTAAGTATAGAVATALGAFYGAQATFTKAIVLVVAQLPTQGGQLTYTVSAAEASSQSAAQ